MREIDRMRDIYVEREIDREERSRERKIETEERK